MFSIPPATTTSACPSAMAWAPSATAFIPEAQTLLMVLHATVLGNPAPSAACRAGACPTFACSTHPIKTSSTSLGSSFIRSSAPRIAADPNSVALMLLRAPIKLPIGVRTADTITTFFIVLRLGCEDTVRLWLIPVQVYICSPSARA